MLLFFIFGVVLVGWIVLLIGYFVIENLKLTRYCGTVKNVQFFKTAKQYKTLLVVKRKFEDKVKGGKPGRVITHFSVILPEVHLKKHLNNNPETVIEKDGSRVEILYLDFTMSRLLIEALQDWFPDDNVEVGIRINEVDDQPLREEREYVLFDISHNSIPYYKKTVSQDDFLLIYCQGAKFSLKVGETILNNVEAYIKITSEILNRPIIAIQNHRVVQESRLYAYQLEGFHENDEEIMKWTDQKTFSSNSYTYIR